MDRSETDIAWAAGLFDGEGTIFANSPGNRPRYVKLNMVVMMTNHEAVERFCSAVGIGKVTELKRKTVTGKTVWRWAIQGTQDVRDAVERLRPYLCSDKLTQAKNALDARDQYESSVEKTTRTRCRNGHSFPENRGTWPNGNGYCIPCREDRVKRSKERKTCVLA